MIHVDWTAVIVAGIAFLGSTGLWTLVDHRQQRRAETEMQNNEVMTELKAIRQEIGGLKATVDENEAKSSRIRILRFADEIFMDRTHSKDSFDQCMSDITFYETYCADHPRFKNHQTEETVGYIKEVYRTRMEKKDFARYGEQKTGGM